MAGKRPARPNHVVMAEASAGVRARGPSGNRVMMAGSMPMSAASAAFSTVLQDRMVKELDAGKKVVETVYDRDGASAIPLEVIDGEKLERLREAEGASYTPFAVSNWPRDNQSGGYLMALVQMQTGAVDSFFTEVDEIVADLAANGPSADELARVVEAIQAPTAMSMT